MSTTHTITTASTAHDPETAFNYRLASAYVLWLSGMLYGVLHDTSLDRRFLLIPAVGLAVVPVLYFIGMRHEHLVARLVPSILVVGLTALHVWHNYPAPASSNWALDASLFYLVPVMPLLLWGLTHVMRYLTPVN